jgi:hypothetical protein
MKMTTLERNSWIKQDGDLEPLRQNPPYQLQVAQCGARQAVAGSGIGTYGTRRMAGAISALGAKSDKPDHSIGGQMLCKSRLRFSEMADE